MAVGVGYKPSEQHGVAQPGHVRSGGTSEVCDHLGAIPDRRTSEMLVATMRRQTERLRKIFLVDALNLPGGGFPAVVTLNDEHIELIAMQHTRSRRGQPQFSRRLQRHMLDDHLVSKRWPPEFQNVGRGGTPPRLSVTQLHDDIRRLRSYGDIALMQP